VTKPVRLYRLVRADGAGKGLASHAGAVLRTRTVRAAALRVALTGG